MPSQPLWIAPSTANSIDVNPYWCSPGGPYYGYRIKSISPSGNSTINLSGVRTSYDGTANFSAYSAGSTVYVDIVFANDKPVVTAQDNSVDLNTNVTDAVIRNKLLKAVTDKEDGTIGVTDSRITYTIKDSRGQRVTNIDSSKEAVYTVEFSYTDRGGKTGTGTAKLEVTDPNAHLTIQYNIHIQDPNNITYSGLRDRNNYKSYSNIMVQKGKTFAFYDRNYININREFKNKISSLTGYCLDYVTVRRGDTGYTQRFNASTGTAASYSTANIICFKQQYQKTNTVIYVDVYYKNIQSDMDGEK